MSESFGLINLGFFDRKVGISEPATCRYELDDVVIVSLLNSNGCLLKGKV